MKTQTVVTIQTRKTTSHKPSGQPVIEVIDQKHVVNQTLPKFYKYIVSQGYMSCELMKVINIRTTVAGVETTSEASKADFEKYALELKAVLKKNGIKYGKGEIKEVASPELDELKSTLEEQNTLIGLTKDELENKEQLLTDANQENEELKTKVAEIGTKDTLIDEQAKELDILRAKLANLPPPAKIIDDMTIAELQDHIDEKGYLIPTNQNKAELIAAIKEAENND